MAFLYILICIAALVLYGYIAKVFEDIAVEKGYSGYFWWCFLCGIAGWLMVVALPDRKQPQVAKSYEKSASVKIPATSTEKKESFDDLPNL